MSGYINYIIETIQIKKRRVRAISLKSAMDLENQDCGTTTEELHISCKEE